MGTVLIDKHNWFDGDIDDNFEFVDYLTNLINNSENKYCAYEYGKDVIWFFKKNGNLYSYFTHTEKDREDDEILLTDSYIIKGSSVAYLYIFINDIKDIDFEMFVDLLRDTTFKMEQEDLYDK